MPVNSASLRLSLNSQSVTSSFGEPLSSTLGHNRHTAVSSFVFFDHQKKSRLYTYPPEFKINKQNCMYNPELHEKRPIIFAC